MRESGIVVLAPIARPSGEHAGREEKVMYLDARQQPQPDEGGAFGYRFVFNAAGLPVEKINLGADGSDKANALGIFKEVREFDSFGNITLAQTVDHSGRPVASRSGIASSRFAYDNVGNLAGVSFYDA